MPRFAFASAIRRRADVRSGPAKAPGLGMTLRTLDQRDEAIRSLERYVALIQTGAAADGARKQIAEMRAGP